MSIKVFCDCGEELDIETYDMSMRSDEVEVVVTVVPCGRCLGEQYALGETAGHIMGRDEAMEEAFDSVNKLVEKALNEHS